MGNINVQAHFHYTTVYFKRFCNLQYINFKYENCVFLALKVVKIPELQGAGALPLNPAGGLGSWLSWFCISSIWIFFSAYNIYLSFYLSSNINWLGLIYYLMHVQYCSNSLASWFSSTKVQGIWRTAVTEVKPLLCTYNHQPF